MLVYTFLATALVKACITEDIICHKAPSEKAVDSLLKECEELKKNMDSFSILTQTPSKSWFGIEKNDNCHIPIRLLNHLLRSLMYYMKLLESNNGEKVILSSIIFIVWSL